MIGLVFAAVVASTSHCDFNCKVRIRACHADAPGSCFVEERYPSRTGLCAFMMNGVATEWQVQHADEIYQSAECVALDDNVL